jgi:hypothetical protein
MKKLALVFVALFIMTGCAVTTSEVMPFGPDTYKIKGVDGLNAQKADTIDKAIKYCESLNKHFMPVQGSGSGATYILIFSCLD